ncbi:MAG: DUF5606 domain-containing protein [Ginsengibacter sp.]
MDYNKIVSVTGMAGLFELVSSKSDGAVVRSLEDNTTKFVSTRLHNFSHLESIEVFTTKSTSDGNLSLGELLQLMKKSTEIIPEANADNKALKAYFEKVYPELDFEKVYASDMKKMVKWYRIIEKNKIEIKLKSPEETGEGIVDGPVNSKPVQTAHVKDMKPQKTATRKIESRGVK